MSNRTEYNAMMVRLTMNGTTVTPETILEYFKDIKTYITSENESTNHHYNILFNTNKTSNAFRTHMKRHFQIRTVKDKHLGYCQLDRGRAAIYISKDQNIIKNDLFTEDELKEMIDQSYTKSKGPSGKNQSITTRLIRNFPFELTKDIQCIDEFVIDYILKGFRGTDSGFDEFVIYKVYNAIVNKNNPEIAKSNMRTRIRNMCMRNLGN